MTLDLLKFACGVVTQHDLCSNDFYISSIFLALFLFVSFCNTENLCERNCLFNLWHKWITLLGFENVKVRSVASGSHHVVSLTGMFPCLHLFLWLGWIIQNILFLILVQVSLGMSECMIYVFQSSKHLFPSPILKHSDVLHMVYVTLTCEFLYFC